MHDMAKCIIFSAVYKRFAVTSTPLESTRSPVSTNTTEVLTTPASEPSSSRINITSQYPETSTVAQVTFQLSSSSLAITPSTSQPSSHMSEPSNSGPANIPITMQSSSITSSSPEAVQTTDHPINITREQSSTSSTPTQAIFSLEEETSPSLTPLTQTIITSSQSTSATM